MGNRFRLLRCLRPSSDGVKSRLPLCTFHNFTLTLASSKEDTFGGDAAWSLAGNKPKHIGQSGTGGAGGGGGGGGPSMRRRIPGDGCSCGE